MNRLARLTSVFLIALALSACALVPERPEVTTPTERLGELHAWNGAIAAETETSLEQGRITRDQAEAVLDTLDEAALVADEAAQALAAGDDPEGRLARIEALLRAAERRLDEEVNDE